MKYPKCSTSCCYSFTIHEYCCQCANCSRTDLHWVLAHAKSDVMCKLLYTRKYPLIFILQVSFWNCIYVSCSFVSPNHTLKSHIKLVISLQKSLSRKVGGGYFFSKVWGLHYFFKLLEDSVLYWQSFSICYWYVCQKHYLLSVTKQIIFF